MDRSGYSGNGLRVSVSRITGDRWKDFRHIRLKALGADPAAFGSTFEREAGFSDSDWMRRVEQYASSPDDCLFLAEVDGSVAGMAAIYHAGDIFNVVSVWVDPSCRGMGLGRLLMDKLAGWMKRDHPGSILRLEVNPAMLAAMNLYRSMGFIPTGRTSILGEPPRGSTIEMELRP